jgi:flagellar hook-associated protein 2
MTTVSSTNFLTAMGAGSGIDTKALAQNLANAEISPKKDQINTKITKTEAKISGYGYIKTALSDLQTAFAGLNDASDFSSIKTSNTQPSAVGVTTSTTALAGTYNLEVSHIATAQRSISTSFVARDTALNEGSEFNLSLTLGSGTPSTIKVKNDTPAGMVSAINSAKLGVKAQLINTGSGYTVMLTGQEGASKSFTMTSDAVSSGTVAFDTNVQEAADAQFKINGLEMTRSSNTVSDVIDGVTLDFYTTTSGAARLDLNRDTTSIKSNVAALVTAYNNFDTTIKELGNSKSTIKDIGGSMVGDSYLQTVRSQVRSLITGNASTPGTDIKAARDMGISFDRYGQMTLDNTKLDAALQDHYDQVVKVFSAGTNSKSVYSPAPAGIAGDAYRSLDRMLRAAGQINTLSDNASTQVTKYKVDLTKLDDQLQKMLDRYTQQFSLMDSIVGNSTSTRASLTSTFSAMNGKNNNN